MWFHHLTLGIWGPLIYTSSKNEHFCKHGSRNVHYMGVKLICGIGANLSPLKWLIGKFYM